MREDLPDEFVAECEEISHRLRSEIGVSPEARLDPRLVAEQLGIEVVSIDAFARVFPNEYKQLTQVDSAAFSAATVFCGTRCLILTNPSQTSTEEALSIAHEIAHRELEHEPTWPLFDNRGQQRSWNGEEEAEAEQLAGAMLVPVLGIEPVLARFDSDPRKAASHFGVSGSLMRRRIAESGQTTKRPTLAAELIGAERHLPPLIRRVPPNPTGDAAPATSPAS